MENNIMFSENIKNYFCNIEIDVLSLMVKNRKCLKDILETNAPCYLINKYLTVTDSHIFIVIGDGKYPKTGARLARKYTENHVLCIDPLFTIDNISHYRDKYKNLQMIKDFDYNVSEEIISHIGNKIPIIISVHGHGDIIKLYNSLKSCICITIPCCLHQNQLLGVNMLKRDRQHNFIPVFDRIEHKDLYMKGHIEGIKGDVSRANDCYFIYKK